MDYYFLRNFVNGAILEGLESPQYPRAPLALPCIIWLTAQQRQIQNNVIATVLLLPKNLPSYLTVKLSFLPPNGYCN